MKNRKTPVRTGMLAVLCMAGAAQAVQVTGGGIGAVVGDVQAPSVVVSEVPLRATLAPTAPLSIAQPRLWGGMKLDTNPFVTARVKR